MEKNDENAAVSPSSSPTHENNQNQLNYALPKMKEENENAEVATAEKLQQHIQNEPQHLAHPAYQPQSKGNISRIKFSIDDILKKSEACRLTSNGSSSISAPVISHPPVNITPIANISGSPTFVSPYQDHVEKTLHQSLQQQYQQQPRLLQSPTSLVTHHRYVPLAVPQYFADDSEGSIEHDVSLERNMSNNDVGLGNVSPTDVTSRLNQDNVTRGSNVTYVQNSDDEEEMDDDEMEDMENESRTLADNGVDHNGTPGEGYSWLHCTRYKPPKLPRSKRKDVTKKRKLGRNPRVPFTQHQVGVLEQKFRQTHYLSSVDVAELSANLNLTETRVKIWFQNRRARERRDKNSPNGLEKELSPSSHHNSHLNPSQPHHQSHRYHPNEHNMVTDSSLLANPIAQGGGVENRLLAKFPTTEEQLKTMRSNPFNINMLHTPWGSMYHAMHGLYGALRAPLGVQYYADNNHHQRALAAQHGRMLALQRQSAFTPVVHNGTRSLPPTD